MKMIITKLTLSNWRNFKKVDVSLRDRVFITGPNSAGKSNFLDAFRFLRDIAAKKGGGLQSAVYRRGGVKKMRWVSARNDNVIRIGVELGKSPDEESEWRYEIGIRLEPRGERRTLLQYERVWKRGKQIVNRPDKEDELDEERLTLTFLESPTTNAKFRDIAEFFESISYLHLVPQLLREVESAATETNGEDYYGKNFLVKVAATPEKIRKARLKRIMEALKVAVPQFEELKDERDDAGKPHLLMRMRNWRKSGVFQREDQFSDGTIRMLGLFWSLLESDGLLLFEEPELSLNDRIVSQLAGLIWKLQSSRNRQVMLSTHSYSLLSDEGIGAEEVLLLVPTDESTDVFVAADLEDVSQLLENGLRIGQVILPRTNPDGISGIEL